MRVLGQVPHAGAVAAIGIHRARQQGGAVGVEKLLQRAVLERLAANIGHEGVHGHAGSLAGRGESDAKQGEKSEKK